MNIQDYVKTSLVLLVTGAMLLLTGCHSFFEDDEDNGVENYAFPYIHLPGERSAQKGYSHNFTEKKYALFAWADQGMHCMDEAYDTFALLPPYSTLKAQLVVKGRSPRIVSSGVTLTYEAVAKKNGSVNTYSAGKSDFWQYANTLFPALGATPLPDDEGLKGKKVQSATPQSMEFNSTQNLFVAEGIPTVPVDDEGNADEYPLVKVVAKDKEGNTLAEATTTLPVSSEMSCTKCHADRMDILEKHDKRYPEAVKSHFNALKTKGYTYDKAGLAQTVQNGTPILCAACHSSHAIPGSGLTGIPPLTEAIHDAHAERYLPGDRTMLGMSKHRNACYACHPGESTKCLRGAMGHAVDADGNAKIQCQNCHGTMYAVAKSGRNGWKDEPNCQACHDQGKRHLEAVTDYDKGTLRAAVDTRFATEKIPGESHARLYRHSTTHGGMACGACHGAQHAIYPSARPEENLQSIAHQGYKGGIRECGVCHGNGVVSTTYDKGPHGMHPITQRWVDKHGTIVLRAGTGTCKACHGADLKGSPLSRVSADRSFKLGVLDRYANLKAGEQVSCSRCHIAPSGGQK